MNKIKTTVQTQEEMTPFYMSLEEAKAALSDDYDFLQERYERSKLARKRPA
jgi:hypothetical protein